MAYHAFLFTRINPAAWRFAGLFALQGVLLFRAGARRITLGYPYPGTPTFGVPCPTGPGSLRSRSWAERDADPVPCVGEQQFTAQGTLSDWLVLNYQEDRAPARRQGGV